MYCSVFATSAHFPNSHWVSLTLFLSFIELGNRDHLCMVHLQTRLAILSLIITVLLSNYYQAITMLTLRFHVKCFPSCKSSDETSKGWEPQIWTMNFQENKVWYVGENEPLEQTYSALREVSCWNVLESILLIWLCCSPLLRKIHMGRNKWTGMCRET